MISAPVSRSPRMSFHTHPRRCNSCLFTGAFCYGRVAEWFKVELLKAQACVPHRFESCPDRVSR